MKLSTNRHTHYNGFLASAFLLLVGGLTSCDSVIFDDQGDCSVHYRLSFRYTKNILNTDAFGSQVTDVNVALYDSNGNLVLRKSERRNLTEDNVYKMDVDVQPGPYSVIAWCSGSSLIEGAESFIIEGQEPGATIQLSGATLQLSGQVGSYYSDNDINPLYYGSLSNVIFPDTYGEVDIDPIYLTKDTNHITVLLQNMDGNPIDPAILEFTLEGSNNQLNWQNQLTGNLSFNYLPWSVNSTTTSMSQVIRADEIPSGVLAEFTTGRIIADREQYLTVKLKDATDNILRIPLVQYLLLVRGQYQQAASNQDYLDRVDDYTLTFFIDEGFTWNKSRIFINNWRVVPPQTGGIQYEED